jgi:heptosyltransferase-2
MRKLLLALKSFIYLNRLYHFPVRTVFFFGEPFFWLLGLRRNQQDIDLQQVRRVLIMRLDEVGDVVMSAPFLRELRRNLPDAWITLIVKPALYNLIQLCPYVNEVLTYDWGTKGYFSALQRHWRALKLSQQHLWRRSFDLAIIPRWDTDYYYATFLSYFSGAPWRVGYSEKVIDRKRRLNKGFDCLLTHVLYDDTLKHEVEHDLQVIRFLGGTIREDRLELWLSPEDEAFAEKILREHGVQSTALVVGFGPSGGNSLLKQWPVGNFVELGRWIQTKFRSYILIVGGPGEEELGSEMEHELGPSAINMVGKVTLRETAALLKQCQLFVGNDAGPMHLAAGIEIPVIALFGSSCHHRFGPWGNAQTVLWQELPCSPCSHLSHLDRCVRCIFDAPHCILSITVEQVKQAVSEHLGFKKISKRITGK